MIKFEKTVDGFNIYFKEYLFIQHTSKNPCVAIGIGTSVFKSKFGAFKVKGKVKKKVPLSHYDIVEYPDKNILLTLSAKDLSLSLSFITVNDKLIIIPKCAEKDINRFWIRFNATGEEAIYGCGEQFSELNLRGKNVPLWTEEQGIGRGDPKWLTKLFNLLYLGGDWYSTYYPQPTFMSSNNYFCHVETSAYAEFNFTKRDIHELLIWNIPDEIIIGKYEDSLLTVGGLSETLGRQPELPEWAYDGVWLGIQGGVEIVNKKLNKSIEHGVKVGAVWCQDWQGIRMRGKNKRLFWNWIYDKELYPELPEYIKSLGTKGVKYMGYINSFLATDGETYRQASERGYCIKYKNGNDYYLQTGNGQTSLVDLSNPDAREWLKSVIKEHMINVGLSGWMADFGEHLPTDCVLHSGEDPTLFHNKYPTIWSQVVNEALEESGKLGEIIFFTRSGYSYTSKYSTLVWAGDQLVDWSMDDGLASVIPAALSSGICGIGYHHSDIGGYTTLFNFKRTPELFMRWAEQTAFTMVMRTHEGNIPGKNIQFDEDDEMLDHFARMSQIHVHLKPYLIALSKEYQKTGIPPMRACFLHYENDPVLHEIKYQYLFGRDLLVAPVIKPGINEWKVYFPDDDWVHIWSESEYKNGWHDISAPIGEPPVFYRKSSEFLELFKELKRYNFKLSE